MNQNIDVRQRDLLRVLGGLVFATGALALFIRKSSQDEWGDFGRLLVVLVPCVLLYLLGLRMLGREAGPAPAAGEARAEGWQSVFLVFAILLVPIVLFQFLDLIGGSTDDSLNTAWIFLLTAVLAALAASRAGVGYGTLLATLAVIIAWLALWDKITSPSAGTFRILLLILAIIFVGVAVALHQRGARQASEVVTGAGVAAVSAGVLGIASIGAQLISSSLAQAFGGEGGVSGVRQHMEWDIFLLLVSVGLIVYGARAGARGPSYVGGFGLLAFIISVGSEVVSIADGDPAEGKLMGWPLLLLLLGAAALAAGFLARPGAAAGAGASAAAPPSPPTGPPAGAPPPRPEPPSREPPPAA